MEKKKGKNYEVSRFIKIMKFKIGRVEWCDLLAHTERTIMPPNENVCGVRSWQIYETEQIALNQGLARMIKKELQLRIKGSMTQQLILEIWVTPLKQNYVKSSRYRIPPKKFQMY